MHNFLTLPLIGVFARWSALSPSLSPSAPATAAASTTAAGTQNPLLSFPLSPCLSHSTSHSRPSSSACLLSLTVHLFFNFSAYEITGDACLGVRVSRRVTENSNSNESPKHPLDFIMKIQMTLLDSHTGNQTSNERVSGRLDSVFASLVRTHAACLSQATTTAAAAAAVKACSMFPFT